MRTMTITMLKMIFKGISICSKTIKFKSIKIPNKHRPISENEKEIFLGEKMKIPEINNESMQYIMFKNK